ncbi:MAG: DHHA1 domain-containing protein [Blautia wexlerae]
MAECAVAEGPRHRGDDRLYARAAYQRRRAHGRGARGDRAVSDPRRRPRRGAGRDALPPQPQAAEIEGSIYQSAVSHAAARRPPQAIVLADESWHQGVVGIVASRMAEEYSCPTFLICLDGDKGKASSRSYGGFNLFRSLEQLSGLLESYGRHELAAGFTIRRACIEPFREKMLQLCAAAFRQSDACSTALADRLREIPPELLTHREYPRRSTSSSPAARAARGRSCACAGCRSRS